MNAVDDHQLFRHEQVVGVALLNDLQRSSQICSNADINKERAGVIHSKQVYVPPAPSVEPAEVPQLEIIGSELGPKTSTQQRSPKNVPSSIKPRGKLSRIDQRSFQKPKRTTFTGQRKAEDNNYPRIRASRVSTGSGMATAGKLLVTSSGPRQHIPTQETPAKSSMVQRKPPNSLLTSSMTVVRKTPSTNNQTSPELSKKAPSTASTPGRGATPLKLPALSKKPTTSLIKTIPSAYIQQFPRFQTSSTQSNRSVLQPTPVLPVYTSRRSIPLFAEQQHLPLIKDRMIKANLAQKASLKCKSPLLHRSDSWLSRSTTAVPITSQTQAKPHNLLKHLMANSFLSEAEQLKLKRLFQQLDTDGDGHLTYLQVQKCLPSSLPRSQETYFRVLYDITSDTTYFGLQEFYTTAVLVDMIAAQDPQIWNSLLDDVDFNYYRDDVIELLDAFDKRCSSITSTITLDTLVAMIMRRTTSDFTLILRCSPVHRLLYPHIRTLIICSVRAPSFQISMCAQSVSGSSLLSGYDDDDVRETSGRSRREFDQVDAVLYGEEAPKRSNIKKISEEWSSKPYFRIRGSVCPTYRQPDLARFETTAQTSSSLFDQSSGHLRMSSFNFNEGNIRVATSRSGRSSIDSTEGSGLTNNSDLEDDLNDADAAKNYGGDRISNDALDLFDTDDDEDDDDDDDDGHYSATVSARDRVKHPQPLIKCLKDSIINTLASTLLERFLTDHQVSLQRYARELCAKNSIVLRRKPRPSSLPPHSLSHNRLSLPTGSSTHHSFQQYQTNITSLPFRSTPEPNGKLNSLLRVTPLRVTNATPAATAPTSPRKSQIPPPSAMERTSTSLTNEKRQQQQQPRISLVGTAVGNLPIQLSYSTPQTSHAQTRPAAPTWRYRSATTLVTNVPNPEPATRLPPITIERLFGSELSINTRSNTISSSNVESVPPASRAVSGVSTGSNASATVRLRAPGNMGKLQRAARPLTITSTKELTNSLSTSPTRAMITTSISSTAFRTSAATRTPHPQQQQQQQQQKRSLLTTNPPPPPSSSSAMKVPVTRIC